MTNSAQNTADLADNKAQEVLSTSQMGDEVINALSSLLKAQKAA